MQILEKNQSRLQALREKTEDKLKEHISNFDLKLRDMLKRVEQYRTIGVSIVSLFLNSLENQKSRDKARRDSRFASSVEALIVDKRI
jgi:hypothetical protein